MLLLLLLVLVVALLGLVDDGAGGMRLLDVELLVDADAVEEAEAGKRGNDDEVPSVCGVPQRDGSCDAELAELCGLGDTGGGCCDLLDPYGCCWSEGCTGGWSNWPFP